MSEGKSDKGKAPLNLLCGKALRGLAMVRDFGTKKYKDQNNWRTIEDPESRYLAAALRHLVAIVDGELIDKESGLPHVDHAMCNLMFISQLHHEKTRRDNNDNSET